MRRSVTPALAAAAVLGLASVASAAPTLATPLPGGNYLVVNAVVGTGSSSAYLAVDFANGTAEAFQYNFSSPLNGYQLLTNLESATTLQDSDTYYPSYGEHFISYVTDGANTTVQYPALYYTPPSAGAAKTYTGPQGVTFQQASSGIDNVAVTNGEIIAFGPSYSAAPTLPSVPEPASLGLAAVVAVGGLVRRRAR